MIAFNFSNIKHGGGLNISTWFIDNLFQNDIELFNSSIFLLSREVYESTCRSVEYDISKVIILEKSPVRSFIANFKARNFLSSFRLDFIFTLFGPSFLFSKIPEISGVANAWITNTKFSDFKRFYGIFSIFNYLKFKVHGFYLSKCTFLIFETKFSRDSFVKKFNFNKKKSIIVPNTASDKFYFSDYYDISIDVKSPVNLFYPATFAPHKNHKIIKDIISLNESEIHRDIVIYLTLDNHNFQVLFGGLNLLYTKIINIGYIDSQKLYSHYLLSHIVISPSLLENFSAVYPEAMLVGRPLLVINRSFSKDICLDNAYYSDEGNYSISLFKLINEYNGIDKFNIRSKALKMFIDPGVKFKLYHKAICKFLDLIND